jgi:hypothetical protein
VFGINLTTGDTEEITEKHVGFVLHDLLNVLGSIFFEPHTCPQQAGKDRRHKRTT